MTTRRVPIGCLAWALATLTGTGVLRADDTVPPSRESRLIHGKADMDAALAAIKRPIDLDFDGAPLADVLLSIKKKASGSGKPEIPVLVNPVALQITGTGLEKAVTIKAQGEPVQRVLSRLLAPLGLTYTVNDGVIVVTYDETSKKDTGKGPGAGDRTVMIKLEEPLTLQFKNAPLEDVLQFITTASRGSNGLGIPIDIDAEGLKQAGVTATTRVSVESLPAQPLKHSLRQLLRSINLAYVVKDGRLRIVASRYQLVDRTAKTKAVLTTLERRLDLKLEQAPLEDVLISIKTATQGEGDTGLPIYIDPVGLQEAEVTMRSPTSIDAKAEPLKTALRKALKPLHLVYGVKDGLLTITSEFSEDAPLEPEGDAPKTKGDGQK